MTKNTKEFLLQIIAHFGIYFTLLGLSFFTVRYVCPDLKWLIITNIWTLGFLSNFILDIVSTKMKAYFNNKNVVSLVMQHPSSNGTDKMIAIDEISKIMQEDEFARDMVLDHMTNSMTALREKLKIRKDELDLVNNNWNNKEGTK